VCNVTHLYVCNMTHSYVQELPHSDETFPPYDLSISSLSSCVRRDSFICMQRDSFICATGLIHMCNMTRSYVCTVTHSYVQEPPDTYVSAETFPQYDLSSADAAALLPVDDMLRDSSREDQVRARPNRSVGGQKKAVGARGGYVYVYVCRCV